MKYSVRRLGAMRLPCTERKTGAKSSSLSCSERWRAAMMAAAGVSATVQSLPFLVRKRAPAQKADLAAAQARCGHEREDVCEKAVAALGAGGELDLGCEAAQTSGYERPSPVATLLLARVAGDAPAVPPAVGTGGVLRRKALVTGPGEERHQLRDEARPRRFLQAGPFDEALDV